SVLRVVVCVCVSSCVFLSCYRDHRDLHSFPTRRSSDLRRAGGGSAGARTPGRGRPGRAAPRPARPPTTSGGGSAARGARAAPGRSEEHTSELQSRENLVCRLLLEKKKKKTYKQIVKKEK